MKPVTLGADPEAFFSKDGHPISAIGLIGGSKWEPKPMGNGYFILEDNVAGEYNIPPANSPSEFSKFIETGLEHLALVATQHDYGISTRASYSFKSEELDNPQAQEFGCEPDFNAWNCGMNPKPEAKDGNFRTCGGHIHVGGVEDLDPLAVIRAMDLFLGCPSVILDADTERRNLYGGAGAFRYKEYGVEYRTLSNFWIFDPNLRYWVATATLNAVDFVRNNPTIEPDSELGALIQQCVNTSDKNLFEKLLVQYPVISPYILVAA